MTQDTQQVITSEDEEWMDGASSTFPKMEDLAPSTPPNFGPGRLIAIWARSRGTRTNDQGKTYPYVETLTLVLDDGPDGDQYNDLVPVAPQRLEGFQHSTSGLVARLDKRIDAVNTKGVKLRNRPMVGRVNTQASKVNKNVPAYSISEPSEADMTIARDYRDLILSINKEMEEKDKTDADTEAFS